MIPTLTEVVLSAFQWISASKDYNAIASLVKDMMTEAELWSVMTCGRTHSLGNVHSLSTTNYL